LAAGAALAFFADALRGAATATAAACFVLRAAAGFAARALRAAGGGATADSATVAAASAVMVGLLTRLGTALSCSGLGIRGIGSSCR